MSQLLEAATGISIDVPVTGLLHQRRDFLALYERLLATEGYRLSALVQDTDAWNATFERTDVTSTRTPRS